jgi:hypothetical protein
MLAHKMLAQRAMRSKRRLLGIGFFQDVRRQTRHVTMASISGLLGDDPTPRGRARTELIAVKPTKRKSRIRAFGLRAA